MDHALAQIMWVCLSHHVDRQTSWSPPSLEDPRALRGHLLFVRPVLISIQDAETIPLTLDTKSPALPSRILASHL